jgi:hypothetical protein
MRQFQLNDHVEIWQILDPGPESESLDLLGQHGRIVQVGTQYSGESYGVLLDAHHDYLPLAFYAAELRLTTVLQPLQAMIEKENQ